MKGGWAHCDSEIGERGGRKMARAHVRQHARPCRAHASPRAKTTSRGAHLTAVQYPAIPPAEALKRGRRGSRSSAKGSQSSPSPKAHPASGRPPRIAERALCMHNQIEKREKKKRQRSGRALRNTPDCQASFRRFDGGQLTPHTGLDQALLSTGPRVNGAYYVARSGAGDPSRTAESGSRWTSVCGQRLGDHQPPKKKINGVRQSPRGRALDPLQGRVIGRRG